MTWEMDVDSRKSSAEPLSYDQMRELHRQENIRDMRNIQAGIESRRRQKVASGLAKLFEQQIPPCLSGSSFECMNRDYDNQVRIINTVRKYTSDLINGQNEGSNLVLTGPPGTGKSHMLVAMMNIAASNGLIACYVSMPHLVRTLHLCVQGETGYSVAGALELLKQADVLLIDEIGRHKATEFNKSFIWDLVDAMHQAQKPIVAATNSSAAELRQLFDPAAMNRLIDRGSQLLVCDWESYRGRA